MAILPKITDSKAAYNPLNDGWNERLAGKRQDDNPFAINNWKYYEWDEGWLAADVATKDEAES